MDVMLLLNAMCPSMAAEGTPDDEVWEFPADCMGWGDSWDYQHGGDYISSWHRHCVPTIQRSL